MMMVMHTAKLSHTKHTAKSKYQITYKNAKKNHYRYSSYVHKVGVSAFISFLGCKIVIEVETFKYVAHKSKDKAKK